MSITCRACGREVSEGKYCPFCGTRLEASGQGTDPVAQIIAEARTMVPLPKRKAFLLEAQKRYPDHPEIEWELLFIGDGKERSQDIIKCDLLRMFRERMPAKERARRRELLFSDPRLLRCLERSRDPEERMEEYLLRLCTEYIEIFLEGDNRVMRTFLGVHLGGSKEHVLAAPCADMMMAIHMDGDLSDEEQVLLSRALYLAFSARTGGATQELDKEMQRLGLKANWRN